MRATTGNRSRDTFAQPLLISQLSCTLGTFEELGEQLRLQKALKYELFTKQVTSMRKSTALHRRATSFKGKMLIYNSCIGNPEIG